MYVTDSFIPTVSVLLDFSCGTLHDSVLRISFGNWMLECRLLSFI